ncbi:MAG: dihydroorotate dehydrogenase-like protein [Candidatus Kapabacteria bacterium]|nr:dihydroorotate dehydrogenase-like protein [Ignavibacteriota bacterium]MCW5885871.1 dihydroorotate dehydrogenase-like protein [Candidatus Kapabacteria bacterium]
MDLTTKYMGMTLKSPLVVSASPLSKNLDGIKRIEDSGASAFVMYSVFEEQIEHEQKELHYFSTVGTDSFAESLSYFPQVEEFNLGPDQYLELIRSAKDSVDIPVIASINGKTVGGWTDFAKQMQQAGADGIELNIYNIPTSMDLSSQDLENNYIEILKAVKSAVTIPVALKVSPFFTNFAHTAKKFDEAGADALVLFNRFYQPDINLEELEVEPHIILSNPTDLRLPMRWIAILKGKLFADLAATSGIHYGEDVIKMLLVGANVTMLCSTLLRYGVDYVKDIQEEVIEWMTEHEYESVMQLQGSMSQMNVADPSSFERAQYMKALNNYVLNY